MICYMPFTSLEDHQKRVLCKMFDTVTVYAPAEGLLPTQMRIWTDKQELEIRYPASVNPARLLSALEEYKAWARLHQGRIGDMAGFFKTTQGRAPLMDETNPSQIGHQIRHYGETGSDTRDGQIFKACLFLSMAQQYDAQQNGMGRQLDEVTRMEQKMVSELSGNGDVLDSGMETLPPPVSSSDHQMPNPHMITQRIRAWSRLALDCEKPPLFFTTPSRDVIEHLLEIFHDAEAIFHRTIPVIHGHIPLSSIRMRQAIQAAASGQGLDCFDVAPDGDQTSCGHGAELTLYQLVGISPGRFLSRLAAYGDDEQRSERSAGEPRHTLIGLVSL
jgi:hypothetical protein